MRRTEFMLLADALKRARMFPYTRDGRADNRTIDRVANAIADAIREVNPSFDRALFLRNAGCGETPTP